MTISAHDLLRDAGVFRRAYPSWPHAEPEPQCAPSLYLVQVPGLPDSLLEAAALASLLASGAKPGGLWDVSVPGRKVPLVLALGSEPGLALVLLPGIAGETEPVVLAEIEFGSRAAE